MLWLALHLPQLPIEVHTRASERPLPAVVAAQQGSHSRVLSANAPAARAGVYTGLALSAAHALVAGLYVYHRDEEAERAALERLATLAIAYTPVVSLAPPRTVLLEIEGSLRLFGGAERLLQRIHAQVRRLGYTASLAIAPTPAGAEWLARAGRNIIVRDLDALRAALHRLPLSTLDMAQDKRAELHDLGVRTLRDLMRLPRAGLARRFGMSLVEDMDRALGQGADPRAHFQVPESFRSVLHFLDPVVDAEALLFTARRQLLELSAFLQARCAAVRETTWQLRHWRQPPSVLRIESSLAHRDARRFLDLLRERMNREALAGGVESIELHAGKLKAYKEESESLLTGNAREHLHDRAQLVDQLRARLGADSTHCLDLLADHRPEFAQRLRPASPVPRQPRSPHRPANNDRHPGQDLPNPLPVGAAPRSRTLPDLPVPTRTAPFSRPLWLLPQPAPLAASGARPQWQGDLTLESGPERIESGWWDNRPVARDYYIARARNGTRLWIYRERSGFTRGRARSISPTQTSPSTPRWFLHGLFS
jgi:protein ImuB